MTKSPLTEWTITMTKRTKQYIIKKTNRVELSETMAVRFTIDQQLIDFSSIKPRFTMIKTGFRDMKQTIPEIILKSAGKMRQDQIAYKIFNKLFGKDREPIVGDLPTGTIQQYDRLINPEKQQYDIRDSMEVAHRMRNINPKLLIDENYKWREKKSSQSDALDAYGLCFEQIRTYFQDGHKKQTLGVQLAIELINWYEYNLIESFVIRKKPNATNSMI